MGLTSPKEGERASSFGAKKNLKAEGLEVGKLVIRFD